MINYHIREITAQDTLPIRHEAMWPDKPLDYVKLSNDEAGRHFGLFFQTKLVYVISLFKEDRSMQFRKFATLPEFQGQGYGSTLLRHIMKIAENDGLDKIWCNARIHKSSYYLKFGLRETEARFYKGGISYVVMEKNSLKKDEAVSIVSASFLYVGVYYGS